MERQEGPRVSSVIVAPVEASWLRRNAPHLAVWAVLLLLLLLFVVQNDDRVRVRLIAWDVHLRLAWALLIAAALGIVIGWFLSKLRR